MVMHLRIPAPDWARGKCSRLPAPTPDDDPYFDDMEEAAAYCNGDADGRICPIRNECLMFALVNNEYHGVWGGLHPLQRKWLRKYVPREEWAWDQVPSVEEILAMEEDAASQQDS